MRLVLLKEIPEDADLRRQWNALVARADQPQVFYTYEWALAVYRAYRAVLLPLLFLAYDEHGSLCGVAALATDPLRRRVSFLCATTGDYCDFIGSAESRREFVDGVLAVLREQKFGEMALANLPADSATASVLAEAAAAHDYLTFSRLGYICAQVSLASLERRGDAKPVLPRKKMLRRFLNAMGREAPVRLDHARSGDQIAAVLPEFIQAHVARFLVTGRISNAARPERRAFLAELAKLLSASGWLVLTRMMSGAKVFAWNYGFQFHGTWFWYQPTFVNDLEKYSPGFCLLAKLIEEAADNSEFKTVDLGLGAEEYKDRFANRIRETLYVTLKSSAVQHYREVVRFYASDMVRKSPRLEKRVRSLVSSASQIKQHVAQTGVLHATPWVAGRLRDLIWLRCEVFFYEFKGATGSAEHKLRPLDLNELASAAAQYFDDRDTSNYLIRAASRLREGAAAGYALVDEAGTFLHFAWTVAFDGFFLSELNAKVDAPSPDCVMVFDCWTPSSARGHGYYAETISQIAALVCRAGRTPWIFSGRSNLASVRGLEKAGFRRRYSLIRQRVFGWQRILGNTSVSACVPVKEVSARV